MKLITALMEARSRTRGGQWAFRLRQPLKTTRIAYHKYTRRPSQVSAHLFTGQVMCCVLPDLISQFIYRFGFHEFDLSRSVLELVNPGDTFIDVGAHFGYFSLLASKLVGPSGSVIALEPTPRTRSITEKNLLPLGNTNVLSYAAWHENAVLEFVDHGWADSALNSVHSSRGDPLGTFDVNARPLDEVLSEFDRAPNFIKIDSEGAELNVLRGAERTLSAHAPIVSIEVGDYYGKESSSRKVLEYAMSLGYRPFEVTREGLRPHVLRAQYEYENLLLAKGNLNLRFNRSY